MATQGTVLVDGWQIRGPSGGPSGDPAATLAATPAAPQTTSVGGWQIRNPAQQSGQPSQTARGDVLSDLWNEAAVNPAKQAAAGVMGAAAGANRLTANAADILDKAASKISDITGLPKNGAFGWVRDWARGQQQAWQQDAERVAGGRQDFTSQLYRGGAQGLAELPEYAIAGAVAGPVAGMGALGALRESDKGPVEALKAAAEGTLMGGALHVMGPASRPIRLAGASSMAYAQSRLNGASHTEALANAVSMGAMAAQHPGGLGAHEIRGLLAGAGKGPAVQIVDGARITNPAAAVVERMKARSADVRGETESPETPASATPPPAPGLGVIQNAPAVTEPEAAGKVATDGNGAGAQVEQPMAGYREPGGPGPGVPEGDGPGMVRGLPGSGNGGTRGGEPQPGGGSSGTDSGRSAAVRRVTGSANVPLTEAGRAQAKALQVRIPEGVQVFTAPNDRSVETGGAGAKAVPWLAPMRMGADEGKPLDAAGKAINDRILNRPDERPGVSPHSGQEGESFNEARDRIVAGVRQQAAGLPPGAAALNITSGRMLEIVDAMRPDGSVDVQKVTGGPSEFSKPGQIYHQTPNGLVPVDSPRPGQNWATHGETAWNQSGGTQGPGEREAGWIGNIPRGDVKVDAPRFQFKQNVGQGGVGDEFREVTKWDPEKAGILSVWKDPADGQTYAVNGHHRVDMANRAENPPDVLPVRYLDAKTAQEARTKGALINISEGRGESTDAAKVFRDMPIHPEMREAFEKELGKGRIATEGLALSKLAQPIFDDVMRGDLSSARGAVIGAGVSGHADQQAVYDLMKQQEKGGKRLTNDQIGELIRLNNGAPTKTESTDGDAQGGLFGVEEMTRSLLPEKARVSDYVRKQLGTEKRLFGTVGTQAAAEKLGEAGNIIKAGENAQQAQSANQGMLLYDRLSTKTGPIADVLDRAAQAIADGENENEVKQRAYKQIRSGLRAQVDQLSGVPKVGAEGNPGLQSGGGAAGTEEQNPRAGAVTAEEVGRRASDRLHGDLAGLENEYAQGRISEPVYRATLGPSSPEAPGGVPRDSGPGGAPPGSGGVAAEAARGNAGRVGSREPEPQRSGETEAPQGGVRPARESERGSFSLRPLTPKPAYPPANRPPRVEALAAFKTALDDPSDKGFGERLRTFVTGERDVRIAETNQLRDDIRRTLPDPVDRQALTLMRDFKGREGEMQQFLAGTHKAYQGMDADERAAAIARVQKLAPIIQRAENQTPDMREMDKALTLYSKKHRLEGQELGLMRESSIPDENYITHILTPKDASEAQKARVFGPKLGPRNFRFAKERQIPTVLDAVAYGAMPRTLDASDALTVYGEKYAKAAAARILARELGNAGAGKWGFTSQQKGEQATVPANWVELGADSRLYRNEVPVTDEKGQAHVAHQQFFVPPEVNDALRPILSRDALSGKPLVRQSRMYQAYIKSMELGLSAFHMKALNVTGLNNEGLSGLVKTYQGDMKSPEFEGQERTFIRAGGTTSVLGRTIEAYKALGPTPAQTLPQKIRALPGLKQADRAAAAVSRLTFDVIQRKLKVTDFSLKDAAWLAKNPSATGAEHFEAQRQIAKEINAAYGGLQWENMGVDPTSLGLARLALLAPDWTFSNVAGAKYATQKGPGGDASRAFWMRSAATGIALTQGLSLILGGKPSKDPTQVYMGKDKNGADVHQNMFFVGAPGDTVNLIRNSFDYGALEGAARTAGNKLGPFGKTAVHLASNEDSLGRTITKKGAGFVKNTGRAALQVANDLIPIPFSATSIMRMMLDKKDRYGLKDYISTAVNSTTPRHDPAPKESPEMRRLLGGRNR